MRRFGARRALLQRAGWPFHTDSLAPPHQGPHNYPHVSATFGNVLSTDWIHTFAGITAASKGIPSQMTATPGAQCPCAAGPVLPIIFQR
jgi:hypothetical protein